MLLSLLKTNPAARLAASVVAMAVVMWLASQSVQGTVYRSIKGAADVAQLDPTAHYSVLYRVKGFPEQYIEFKTAEQCRQHAADHTDRGGMLSACMEGSELIEFVRSLGYTKDFGTFGECFSYVRDRMVSDGVRVRCSQVGPAAKSPSAP